MYALTKKEILQFLEDIFEENDSVVDEITNTMNKQILEKHPYPISLYSDGRWKTYVPDATKKNGRRQIAKATREAVEAEIIRIAREQRRLEAMTLEKCYNDWMLYRRDIEVEAKTIIENRNDWRRFLANHPLAQKSISSIQAKHLDEFFMSITPNHCIGYRALSNVRGTLNGIFDYALCMGYIASNPLDKINLADYKKRCRPVKPKDIYTQEERQALLDHLAPKEDVYSLAIQLAFFLCVRIGELCAIKKSDINDGEIFIQRSQRKMQELNDDLSPGPVQHYVADRIKGNLSSGFRRIPLTPQAQQIVQRTMELHPEGDYLFERNGRPIRTDTFNEHLKRACKAVGIPYRSSHTIRFTAATDMAAAGIPVTEICTMLGHSDTATTFHYIRPQQVSSETARRMQEIFDNSNKDK